jgi:hypothetical protein
MAAAGNYKYPLNIGSADGEYKHRITFSSSAYSSGTATSSTTGTATLYMPGEALKSNYGQTYGDAELGALGNLVSGMNREGGLAVASAMKSGSMSGVKAALGSALGSDVSERVSAALKESTAKAIKDKASGGMFAGASTALQNVLGQVRNPHKAIVYTGPGGFRSFSYTFVMTPESADEAKEIADIVYFFKFHMHPGVSTVEPTAAVGGSAHQDAQPATQGSSSFTYPDEWKIELHANGLKVKDNFTDKKPALFRINNCFLESLTTDFTTSGQPAFFQGGGDAVPVTTTLGLTFKETVLVTRNDIAKGY